MSVFKKVKANEVILRFQCENIETKEEEEVLIKILENEIKLNKAHIAISAPQLNLFKKASIIRKKNFKVNLVNPEIVEASDRVVSFSEYCSSFPLQRFNCYRFNNIKIKNGLKGKIEEYTGEQAFIVQHEIDHLHSSLFFDKAISLCIVRPGGEMSGSDICYCGKRNKFKNCCMNKK